ncbi:hypothetical protein V2G26_018989 [Clonostachys chloroleuca]
MRVSTLLPLAAALAQQVTAAPASKDNATCLPIVDLGYELHRAIWHNPDTDLYKFQNIRYARAPTANLRFRAPLPP